MSAFNYTESLITVRRKGDSTDPYIPITKSIMIKNGVVQLPEIPNQVQKVTVTGSSQSWYEVVGKKPENTEYKVSYLHGYVEFDPVHDGKILQFSFMGTGNTFLSVDRIWVDSDGYNVTRTLGDIVDAGEAAIESLEKVDQAVALANEATDKANQAAGSVRSVVEEANETISELIASNASILDAENLRVLAENSRQTSEQARESNESTRQEQEADRQGSESARNGSESLRESQELNRQQNEAVRQQQESQRQLATATAIESTESASRAAQSVADQTRGAGIYSSSTTYVPNNFVTRNGSTYMALTAVTGIAPETDAGKWQLIAQRGVDGTGSVVSVNHVSPELDGNIQLDPSDIGAASLDETGNVPLSQLGNVEGMEMHGNEWHTEDFETVSGAQTKAIQAKNDANAYTDQQIQLVTETGIPKLVSYQFKLTATDPNQTVFEIPLDTFESTTDTLMVYRNTTYIDPSNYVITNTATEPSLIRGSITLSQGVSAGTELVIVLLKNVPIGADGTISGTVLAAESIPENRVIGLSDNLNAMNNHIEELAGSGRTSETVKGNFDALAVHKMDYAANGIKRDGSVAMAADLDMGYNGVRRAKSMELNGEFWSTTAYRSFLNTAVAQEVEITLPLFAGVMEITVASGWGVGNASGAITKRFNLASNPTSIVAQHSYYTNLSPYTRGSFMITDAYMSNGVCKVKLVRAGGSSNSAAIYISALSQSQSLKFHSDLVIGEVTASSEAFVAPVDYYLTPSGGTLAGKLKSTLVSDSLHIELERTGSSTGKVYLGTAAGAFVIYDSTIGRSALIDPYQSLFVLGGAYIQVGNGSPEGAVAAPVGSLWLRLNGGANTTLYVKQSGTGNTGWTAK